MPTSSQSHICYYSPLANRFVGDGLPVPHKNRVAFLFFGTLRTAFPTASCDDTYNSFILRLSNPQALCASSFAKGAYAVSHGFADSLLLKLNFRLGLLRKGAARRAED